MTFRGENIPIAAEVTRAARELVGRGVDEPVVLGYHPVARMNPFQELLYSTGPGSGVGVVPLIRQADFPVLEGAVKMGVPAVLHLHWTSAIMAPALNEVDAERRGRLFIAELEDLRSLGVRLLWTVHNVLPHHCTYPTAESRMRGELAALADGIHIMNPATVEEVAEYYDLPHHKTFQIPHPSYAGFYPRIARGNARFALGFEPDDIVIGAIGSIQPYKGLRALGAAVAEVSRSDRRVVGLVAGMPGPDSPPVIADLSQWPSVHTIAKKLTDRELAHTMTAIDFMALPYERTLNSGAAALAATFGVPVIAPHVGAFLPMLDAGMGIGFDPEEPAALVSAVASAADGDFLRDPAGEESYLSSIDPRHVSERFFREIVDKMST